MLMRICGIQKNGRDERICKAEIKSGIKCEIEIDTYILGFPGGLDGKQSACHGGNGGSILGSGRSPGGGHGNPLQCSRLKNPMDRGAWWAKVHKVTKSQTQMKWLSTIIPSLTPADTEAFSH